MTSLSVGRRRHLVDLGNGSSGFLQSLLHGELVFEGTEIFRVDVFCRDDELLHLYCYVSLDLELLNILHVSINRVLLEEVTNKDVFDVGTLVTEPRCSRSVICGGVGSLGEVPLSVWFSEGKRLRNVHFSCFTNKLCF